MATSSLQNRRYRPGKARIGNLIANDFLQPYWFYKNKIIHVGFHILSQWRQACEE